MAASYLSRTKAATYLDLHPPTSWLASHRAVRCWEKHYRCADAFADALMRITRIAAAEPLIDYRHRRSALADYRIPASDLAHLGIRSGPRGYVEHLTASVRLGHGHAVGDVPSPVLAHPERRSPAAPLARLRMGTGLPLL